MIALWIFGWLFIGWLGVFGFNRYIATEVKTEDIPSMLMFILLGPVCVFILAIVVLHDIWDERRYKVSSGWLSAFLGGKRVKKDANPLY